MNTYREKVTSFTKAHNFPNGIYLLATIEDLMDDDSECLVSYKGAEIVIIVLATLVIKRALSKIEDNITARGVRDIIKRVLVQDRGETVPEVRGAGGGR